MNPEIISVTAGVFAIMAVGAGARKLRWLSHEADESLLRITIRVLLPCLIIHMVANNEAMHRAVNLWAPPLVGFVSICVGIALSALTVRLFSRMRCFEQAKQRRTFALSVGIFNYGYIPLPLVGALYGAKTTGVLFVHNVGVEVAMWTVGLIVLTGGFGKAWWKHVVNPPLAAIVLGIMLNLSGAGAHVPGPIMFVITSLGAAAIPMGLLLIGATMADELMAEGGATSYFVIALAIVLRLAILPAIFLLAARWLPWSIELKQVIAVQAAMPAAVFPIVLAKHYGGDPGTATGISLATSVVGLATMPIWLYVGPMIVGLP